MLRATEKRTISFDEAFEAPVDVHDLGTAFSSSPHYRPLERNPPPLILSDRVALTFRFPPLRLAVSSDRFNLAIVPMISRGTLHSHGNTLNSPYAWNSSLAKPTGTSTPEERGTTRKDNRVSLPQIPEEYCRDSLSEIQFEIVAYI